VIPVLAGQGAVFMDAAQAESGGHPDAARGCRSPPLGWVSAWVSTPSNTCST
jgi:hypothetical protein